MTIWAIKKKKAKSWGIDFFLYRKIDLIEDQLHISFFYGKNYSN